MVKLSIADEEAMLKLGASLADKIHPGDIVFLRGDLGAGKTTLVRGFLRAKGHEGAVKSPTFTLVESYHLDHTDIYHFDLYRLTDPYELELMGFRDYLRADAICLIEWPEKAGNIQPMPTLNIHIRRVDKDSREVEY